jgi:hypothetical protein
MENPTSNDATLRPNDSQESPSVVKTEQLEKPAGPPQRYTPSLWGPTDKVSIIKRGKKFISEEARLTNSLLATVGFLELANAGDFAANVWNDVPIPKFAVALMSIGGVFALVLSTFAFKDAKLSWDNICVLRRQRRTLRDRKAERLKELQTVRDVDVLLDVTFRELGSEAINRFGMDVLLGCGAIVIGVGTLLAIDGGDHNAMLASNLLSGYIGNGPLALYGLINLAWCVLLWRKAGQHRADVARVLEDDDTPTSIAVRRRSRNIQIYSAASGTTSILSAGGSMITATLWYGYVILIPVIISSILSNFWWRRKIGYERPSFANTLAMNAPSLMAELDMVVLSQQELENEPSTALERLTADAGSLTTVLDFLVVNDLFEDFCLELCKDEELLAVLCRGNSANFIVEATGLLDVPNKYHNRLLEEARRYLGKKGLRRFQFRERYIVETLGSYFRVLRAFDGSR